MTRERMEQHYEAQTPLLDALVANCWGTHSVADICLLSDSACAFAYPVSQRQVYSSWQRVKRQLDNKSEQAE